MEHLINDYISHELVSKPELLPFENETPLLEAGILDSLSMLRLVLFIEEKFDVKIKDEDFIPEHFRTVNAICAYLRSQQQVQGVQG